jgi:hypothetical protein
MRYIIANIIAILIAISPSFAQIKDNAATRFDFRGGISRLRRPFDNQVCVLKNAKPLADGTIEVRGGQREFSTIGSATGGNIEALSSYYNVREGFILYSVKREDGVNDTAYVTEATGTTQLTLIPPFGGGDYTSIVQYDGVVYILNGRWLKYHDPDVPMGYTLRKVQYEVDQDPIAGTIAIMHLDRMYVSHGGSLRWSNAGVVSGGDVSGLPTVDFPNENFIRLGDLGNPLTAIASGQDFLVVFTRDSFHIQRGNPGDDGSPGDVFWQHFEDGVGTVSQRAVSVSDETVYFYGANKRMYAISGTGLLDLDPYDYVQEYLEAPGADAIKDVSLSHRMDELWIYAPKGNTSTEGRTLVYLPALNAWTVYENINGNVYSWATEIDRFFVGALSGGKIWEQDSGSDDDGTAIEFEMITRHESLGPFRYNKRFRLANVQADLFGGDTLNIRYSVNNGASFTAFPNGSTLENTVASSWGAEAWGASAWSGTPLKTGWARFNAASTIKGRDMRLKFDGNLKSGTKFLNYHIEGDVLIRND